MLYSLICTNIYVCVHVHISVAVNTHALDVEASEGRRNFWDYMKSLGSWALVKVVKKDKWASSEQE